MRKELKNSSIRDVVDFLDYDVNPDVWINRLVKSIKEGTYEPELPRRFTLGKSKGFSRTMTLPAVPDLVLYRSLVDCIFLKGKTPPTRARLFSSRAGGGYPATGPARTGSDCRSVIAALSRRRPTQFPELAQV
ncbi:MAG TPA: hypothetical protein VFW83_00580 [Bryobacteraceae bacterium]|nr:hypothetical protein [Bryobacteraceae bacterium]